MSNVSDDTLESLLFGMDEVERLQSLSNEDLVCEYRRLRSDQDQELHINEMMNRLWADWDQVQL